MSGKALALLLRDQSLAETIRAWQPSSLTKVIREIGLEDAGPLLALLDSSQLSSVLDEDLWSWRSTDKEERFDAEKFLTWIEVLSELGPKAVVQKLLSFDESFLILAFSRLMLVLNQDDLARRMLRQNEDLGTEDLIDKALESHSCLELSDYLIVFQQEHAADLMSDILSTMQTEDSTALNSLLEGCERTSRPLTENNESLYQALVGFDEAQENALNDRQERRAQRGYVSRADALGFLNLARLSPPDIELLETDPFLPSALETLATELQSAPSAAETAVLQKILNENHQPLPRLASSCEIPATDEIHRLLELIHKDSPERHERFLQELAFLGNALISGCTLQGRQIRGPDAIQIVAATCHLALLSLEQQGNNQLLNFKRHGPVTLFRWAWGLLFRDVSMATLNVLLEELSQRKKSSSAKEIHTLFTEFSEAKKSRSPWRALSKLHWLERAIGKVKTSQFRAFLDECPHLVESSSSPLVFISTPRHISAIIQIQRGLCP